MIMEETKDHVDPLLNHTSSRSDIIFTTKKKDTEHLHIKGKPVSYTAVNITSYMGGRANLWVNAKGRVGLQNPYSQDAPSGINKPKQMEKQLGF